jgi:hypothetical protein
MTKLTNCEREVFIAYTYTQHKCKGQQPDQGSQV